MKLSNFKAIAVATALFAGPGCGTDVTNNNYYDCDGGTEHSDASPAPDMTPELKDCPAPQQAQACIKFLVDQITQTIDGTEMWATAVLPQTGKNPKSTLAARYSDGANGPMEEFSTSQSLSCDDQAGVRVTSGAHIVGEKGLYETEYTLQAGADCKPVTVHFISSQAAPDADGTANKPFGMGFCGDGKGAGNVSDIDSYPIGCYTDGKPNP